MIKVRKIYIIFFKGLCCFQCVYEQLHKEHKLVKLDDKENLKKQDLTIGKVIEEFNAMFEKVSDLKNKIDKEIVNINSSFDKTMNDIKQYFIEMHEKLLKEENELIEKLKNEVTKVKEKMENTLSEINEEIRLNDRINKIANKLEKDDENLIKMIAFVSKIKNHIAIMNETMKKPLKSIEFNFKRENKSLDFKEYNINKGSQFNVDSKILEESNRIDEFLNLIYEWAGCKNMQLLYRGTKDGMTSKHFHEICDNQGKTITLYRNIKGYIFGGFASIPWSTEGGTWKSAPESFVFTLTNAFDIKPTKLSSKHDENQYKEVFHNKNYGPTFGNDFGLYSDFTKNGWAFKFKTYEDISGKSNSLLTGENADNTKLFINEIEVFKIE